MAAALGVFFYSLGRGTHWPWRARWCSIWLWPWKSSILSRCAFCTWHWRGVLGTPAVLRALTVVVVAQFAFTDLPAMQAVFDTRPVAFTDGWLIMEAGMAIMIVLESEKIVMRRVGRRY
nr:hypothetical protein BN993_02846 [Virgibacillus halodenitrificans]